MSCARRLVTPRSNDLADLDVDPMPIRLVFVSSTISNLGDGLRVSALPLLAASFSRDPVTGASITALIWLPWLIFWAPRRFARRSDASNPHSGAGLVGEDAGNPLVGADRLKGILEPGIDDMGNRDSPRRVQLIGLAHRC
jgi:hypothetical protein